MYNKRFKETFHCIYSFGEGTRGQLGHEILLPFSNPKKIRSFTSKNNNNLLGVKNQRFRFIDVETCINSSFVINDKLEVFAWGKNESNCLGFTNGTPIINEPRLVETLKHYNICSIAAGRIHTYFLSTNQQIFAVGSNEVGQIGNGTKSSLPSKLPIRIDSLKDYPIVMIASGLDHGLALSEKGQVWSWGWGVDGQLGQGNLEDLQTPKQIDFNGEIIARIYCGSDYSAFLTEDGIIYTCGCNESGELGLGDWSMRNIPCMVESLANKFIISLACGSNHMLALTDDGKVYSWGGGKEGQLGRKFNEEFVSSIASELQNFDNLEEMIEQKEVRNKHFRTLTDPIPGLVEGLENKKVIWISAGGATSFALTDDGMLYSWGLGIDGRHGHFNFQNIYTPKLVDFFKNKKIVHISAGVNHTLITTEENENEIDNFV